MTYDVWIAESSGKVMYEGCRQAAHIQHVDDRFIDMFLALAQSGLCTVMITGEDAPKSAQ